MQTAGEIPDSADIIVLGSGAAGLTAALTAALDGARVLLLERDGFLGGTSARSSGAVWIPDNPHMRAAGMDDRAAAEAYLEALVDGQGPAAMWRAFLDAGPRMLTDLEARAGLALRPFTAAPDYRQDLPGAASGWRALESPEFDGRALGPDFAALAPPLPELTILGGMMLTRAEAARLLRADRSVSAALLGLRLVARHLADRLRHARGTRLVMGNALVARLLHAALRAGVTIRRGTDVQALALQEGRVTGVTLAGRAIRARAGVILAGGGFPASAEWRARELPEPTPRHSPATPGATGRTLDLALAAGAVLGPSGRDNALWFPCSTATRHDGSTAVWPHIVLDRAKPGSVIVGRDGRRIANEAISYHEFGRAMYAASRRGIPAWLICDRAFIRRYGLGLIRPRTPVLRRHIARGYLVTAPDSRALAARLNLPADALAGTLAAMNRAAQVGRDAEFGRGETIYDRAGGDPAHGPNPCLGPIGPGPLFAVRLEPAPLGTSRGLAADRQARVLDASGTAIPGLWVAGNDMQSAFGGEYPGAGAQLGQGMTFGWIAARDALGRQKGED